jgi:alcohol dehydrogenase
MKAAVLESFGSELNARSLPDPVIGTGEVLVDVVAAPVRGGRNKSSGD